MSMRHKIIIPITYQLNPNGWAQQKWVPIYPEQKYIDSLKAWCREYIGVNQWNYFGQYRKVPFEFRFKRSEDLLAFKLTHGL